MKKILGLMMMLLVGVVSFSGCTKDDEGNNQITIVGEYEFDYVKINIGLEGFYEYHSSCPGNLDNRNGEIFEGLDDSCSTLEKSNIKITKDKVIFKDTDGKVIEEQSYKYIEEDKAIVIGSENKYTTFAKVLENGKLCLIDFYDEEFNYEVGIIAKKK
jgi:hypothetical protein